MRCHMISSTSLKRPVKVLETTPSNQYSTNVYFSTMLTSTSKSWGLNRALHDVMAQRHRCIRFGTRNRGRRHAINLLHRLLLPPYPRSTEPRESKPRERVFLPTSFLYEPYWQYEGEALIGFINATRRACMRPKGGT